MRGIKSVLTAAAVVLTTAPLAAPLHAQDGYLFRQPQVTLSLRVGAAAPQASDDLFDFFTKELTLEKKDFRSVAWGADLSARLSPRLDLVIGLGNSQATRNSEFREWVDQDDQPIEQVTRLRRTPLTFSAKYHLRPRGTSLSQYAWVPERLQPYLGAGVGVMFYDLEQDGDFVDFETLDVFHDNFRSTGNAPMFQVLAGADMWVIPRVALTVEGRYARSSATLREDFSDFDTIALHGFQLTTGLALRF